MKKVGITKETGTTVSFMPDAEIFEELEFSADTLRQHFRETAFLTRGLRIVFTDERAGGETVEFHYEGGIKDFVAYVNESKDPVHRHIAYFENESDDGTSRWRCSGTRPTRTRSTPSPTTSTRSRAAPTCRASAPP